MSTRARTTRATSGSTTGLSTRTRKKQQEESSLKAESLEEGDLSMIVDGLKQYESIVEPAAPPKPASKNGQPNKSAKRGSKKGGQADANINPVDCTCSRGDDGSPMILCAECQIWYHFICVDVSEPDAQDIRVFVCPSCSEATRRRTTMNWEGDEALEQSLEDPVTILQRRKAVKKEVKQRNRESNQTGLHGGTQVILALAEDSHSGDDSEDEYVEDDERKRSGRKRLSRLRRASTATADDDASEMEEPATNPKRSRLSRSKVSPSGSPGPSHHLKRKATNHTVRGASPPPSKRKKSGSQAIANADSDPARKYCLGKMEDTFKAIFLKYSVGITKDENDPEATEMVFKKQEELSDEEKEHAIEQSKQFARELESCVFEIYAEPDKHNEPHAGPKYKDRFRTLQFNLSKPDRVVIHQKITAGTLSAKEISTMSSTDLADEETKQSIKLAEKEALAHSILQKQTAPRAKITHKGLQDIEDVRGDVGSNSGLELQKEREREDEERIERERLARLRTTNVQRQRTSSMSVPPESPTAKHQTPSAALLEAGLQQSGGDSWGGPPPVPLHAMTPTNSDDPQRPPLFIHTSSDFIIPNVPLHEPELNLNDLINIDEDQESEFAITSNQGTGTGADQPLVGPNFVSSPTEANPSTGISPFAQRQDRPRTASFDLNALWSQQGKEDEEAPPASDAKDSAAPSEVPPVDEHRSDSDNDDKMELESVEANDQDFDMILAEESSPAQPEIITPSVPKTVEELGKVWTGKITMPLDSAVLQETILVAKQIGGKTLSDDSPLWKTLFPVDVLRVEGRVPVDNAVNYLVQMRMNPTKELYAVAFAPANPENEEDFKSFNNFLLSKNRHGLVFPWGSRPRDYHPGKELYMIPLLQSVPLPEFVELLVDLKMPTARTRDYLLGVWILNKGKLAPLPGPPSQSTAPTPPISLTQPTISPPPPFGATPPIPAFPPHGSPLTTLSPNAISGLPNPSALAAEVASLTPEQIQSVLRSLASTAQVAPQIPPVGNPPLMPGMPSQLPPPNQPWVGPPPAAASPYPPGFPHSPYQSGPSPSQNDQHNRMNYDRYGPDGYARDHASGGYNDRDHSRRGSDRGERGWRGPSGRGNRGAGRGRGRGRGANGREEQEDRQRDSGWPRKSKNEGHGGPPW